MGKRETQGQYDRKKGKFYGGMSDTMEIIFEGKKRVGSFEEIELTGKESHREGRNNYES